jgi:adenine-specific DNA-methyltransferase
VQAVNKDGTLVYLEKTLLKPIIKGSKLKNVTDPIKEYILFPYTQDMTGKQRIIDEKTLQEQFPKTYSYFLKVKPALDRRDNGKPNAVAWYAFRTRQGLDSSFGKKIIFSPMNLAPNFILYENPDVTVYSGYFIKYDGDYQALIDPVKLQTNGRFYRHCRPGFPGRIQGLQQKSH